MFGGWYSIQYPLLYVILSTFRLFNVWHCILYIYTRIYIHTYIYILYWSHHGTSSCCGGCSFYLGKLTQIWITLKNPLFPGELKLYNWMKKYIICIIYIYILVDGSEHFLFFHILGIIILTDYCNIFQRDWNHQPVYIYTVDSILHRSISYGLDFGVSFRARLNATQDDRRRSWY